MKRSAIRLGVIVILAAAESYGQERRVYEGVVDLKQKTIGTVVLLEIAEGSLKGWVRLQKFVPIEGGSASANGAEFRAGGNRYEIDERKGKISYSGPDGEGSRFVQRLERLSGRFEELSEESGFSGVNIAAIEVRGRRRDLRVGRPALWKQDGPPFETFERIEEMLGKEIAVWVAGANERTGRVVAVEEPEGMNIPLKAPKKPKETQPKKPTR
ncbi:MAG: hypothetical protein A3H28_13670 [Acidobacteria bacterium RIFCSPLOWO2_02_FULL_61_28]|nr:MAG: hypothetical protein A3H28_13670 [Acidobacteria bacterium RIFCSPLOWO2_02_FULL_61_28]